MARTESGDAIPAEPFLDRATLEWLPMVGGENDRVTRAALEKLSGMLIASHQDYWLSEMTRSPINADWMRGTKLLAEAIRLNGEGDRETGYARAREATVAFQRSGSSAGKIRADLEAVYSLSRSFQTAKCIEESGSLLSALQSRRYAWSRIQAILARSNCLFLLGDFTGTSDLKEKATRLAEDHHYRQLFLRVIGLNASLKRQLGDFQTARHQNYEGLKLFWAGTYPAMRAYQFYSELDYLAERNRQWRVGYLISREEAPMIEFAGNRTTESIARYRLAMFAGMTGHPAEADREIRRAEELMGRVGDQESTRTFRASNMILLANSYLENGALDLAGKVLEDISPADVKPSFRLQLRLHGTRGTLAVRHKAPVEARRELEIALQIAESLLENAGTERDRANWAKEAGPVYRELIRIAIDDGAAERGLTLWQVYRSAGFAGGKPQKNTEAASERLRGIRAGLKGASILSMIQFEDRLDGWLVDDRGVFSYRSPLSRKEAEAACSEFRTIASTMSSDPRLVREAGSRLYRWLVEPVAGRLRDGQMLAIQPDGPCAGIPFEALVDGNGSYLVERVPLFTAPGAFAIERLAQAPRRVTPELRAVIVGDPRLTDHMAENYPELPDAAREAAAVAGRFRRPLVLAGRLATLPAVQAMLPEAEVFHFAGHGVSTSENGTLLLAPGDAASGAALLESAAVDGFVGKCRLAVLSACHSAAGERLGPFNPDSLVQAFWRAAVPNVVATRWNVDSRAAFELVTDFYRRLLEGQPPGVALRAAQREILSHPATSHPAYWAGFHLYGSSISVSGEAQP